MKFDCGFEGALTDYTGTQLFIGANHKSDGGYPGEWPSNIVYRGQWYTFMYDECMDEKEHGHERVAMYQLEV